MITESRCIWSHTITDIHGNERVTGVTVAQVDEHMKPIPGTEKEYNCDTVILSVGLIPENELSIDAGVTLDARTKGRWSMNISRQKNPASLQQAMSSMFMIW